MLRWYNRGIYNMPFKAFIILLIGSIKKIYNVFTILAFISSLYSTLVLWSSGIAPIVT